LTERGTVEIGDDVAAEAKADSAALFADDDHHRVRLFGDADGGAMARSEAGVDDARFGHREKDARLGDAKVTDDDGAVVQLVDRFRNEERNEKLARDRRFDGDSLGHHELVEIRVLLEGDERAHAMPCKLGGRGHHFVDDTRLLGARESAEKGAAADAHEPAADVVLKNDHHDQNDRREQRRQKIEQRNERQPLGRQVHEKDDEEPHPHLHGARTAQHDQRAVDDVGDDQKIE
jgi:hypothetical protein